MECQLTGSQPLAARGAGGDAHLLALVQRGHAAAAVKIQRLGGGLRLRHREHAYNTGLVTVSLSGASGVFTVTEPQSTTKTLYFYSGSSVSTLHKGEQVLSLIHISACRYIAAIGVLLSCITPMW